MVAMKPNLLQAKLWSITASSCREFHVKDYLPQGARAFINGKWLKSISKQTFGVTNPYTNEVIADVANCDGTDAQIAVQAAREAFYKWSLETTAKERSNVLRRWYDIIVQRESQLAELLTLEQGKPLAEAKGEIQYAASFLDYYSGEARRIHGQVVQPPVLGRQHFHTREPIGVVAVITPWNFPTAMIARKAGAALAAGCSLVIKPAEDTPLSALALAETSQEAGIPNGVFNVLPADRLRTAEISRYLCESPEVDCISFTGSTAVGKLLLVQSASTVKRVCLELGGNAPFIVFESADLDVAVAGAIASKFRCSGQTCVSANRFFVQESIHDQFVEKLAAAMSKLVCGNGLEPKTTQGPLINEKAIKKVHHLVDEALAKGATLIAGGKVFGDKHIYEPTLLTGVTTDMQIAHEEIFGPVVAVQKFTDEEDAVTRANHSRHGLAGYFFSTNLSQVFRVGRRIQTGMLGINEGAISCAEAAFGGVKESGMGREGAEQGIDEFTQWKYTCLRTQ
uniref:Aldedh domain-containing protein n=1 Tax=Panagrellus redivivus TaxID=6233 RepID=A0A7E5A1R5_PANRE